MADDADVQAPEITPEDFDGEQETPKAESSTVEAPAKEEKPEAKDTKETKSVEAKATPDVPDVSAKDKEDTLGEVDKPEDTPKDEKPAPKSENRYRTLANENRDLRRQVETLTAQTYQPATEEELTGEVNPETGENYNRLEAKFESYRQQQELEKYTSQVTNAQTEIGSEAYSVMQDFPAFNPDDKENFDEELAAEAAILLEANLIRDPNVPELDESGQPTGKGIVIGSNVSPYQLYKTLARASGISGTKGQLKGQQATEKMLANADASSSAAPAKKPTDPLSELWKEDL